jgi:hypothetical protein
MRHPRLLECGGHRPDLATVARDLVGDFGQNLKPWRVDAVVIGVAD